MSQVLKLLNGLFANSFKLLRELSVGCGCTTSGSIPPKVIGEVINRVKELHGGDTDRSTVNIEAGRRVVMLVEEVGEAVKN